MTTKMSFHGKVVNGHTKMYQPGSVAAFVASLEGKEISVTIEKMVIKKTLSQLRGIYLLLRYFTTELNKSTGNNFSEAYVKKIVKFRAPGMLVSVIDEVTGEFLGEELRSLGSLEKEEASNFITFIYAYAATEFNIILPPLEHLE